MNLAKTVSPAQQRQAASRADGRTGEADEDNSFNGWLASSLELKFGLLVQYLRIDPLDAEWRDVFTASNAAGCAA